MGEIREFLGRYLVTSEGVIIHKKTGLIKYTWLNRGRSQVYERVQFCINGSRKNYYVHRLVAELFLPEFNLDYEVNHIDGNPLNNCVSNLEVITRKENQLDAYYQREVKMFINGLPSNVVMGSYTVNNLKAIQGSR